MARHLPDDVIAVMRSLLERLDELVEQVLENVWSGVEEYQDALDDKVELECVVHRSLEVVLGATADLRPIGPEDLADSERLGETRALQGFAAVSLLQSYRAAERCLVDSFLYGAAGLDGPGCGRGIRSLTMALDQLERAAVLAHQRTEQAVALAHETTVAALLTQLASGVGVDAESLLRQAAIIDIDPDHSYVGVAVLTPGSMIGTRLPNLRRQLARRIADLQRAKVPSVTWQGLMLFLVPRNVPDERLLAVLERLASQPPLGSRLIIGVGDPSADLIGTGQSFRHAGAAAHLGSRQGLVGEVVVYAKVALPALLAENHDTCRTMVKHRLGPLLERPELLKTIRAYLECDLAVKRTAQVLGVHANTVSYRLRQIEELIGINARRVRDVADVDVAVRAMELLPPGWLDERSTPPVDGRHQSC